MNDSNSHHFSLPTNCELMESTFPKLLRCVMKPLSHSFSYACQWGVLSARSRKVPRRSKETWVDVRAVPKRSTKVLGLEKKMKPSPNMSPSMVKGNGRRSPKMPVYINFLFFFFFFLLYISTCTSSSYFYSTPSFWSFCFWWYVCMHITYVQCC